MKTVEIVIYGICPNDTNEGSASDKNVQITEQEFGAGGWAALLSFSGKQKEITGGAESASNNKMTLQSAIEALSCLKEPCKVELTTESQYLQKGMTENLVLWKQNSWRNSKNQLISYKDYWQILYLLNKKHEVFWVLTPTSDLNLQSERLDRLAKQGMAEILKGEV